MSDEQNPAPPVDAAAEEARQQNRQMLDLCVRHLYATALLLCRITGGNVQDVPRILVAAGAHSVQSLLEKLGNQQTYLEKLEPGDPMIPRVAHATNVMAGDLAQSLDDFERALLEALSSVKDIRELEPDGSMPQDVDKAGEKEPEPGPAVH